MTKMYHKNSDDDETIVANTIAEICIILVLLFFLAVGIVFLINSGEKSPLTFSDKLLSDLEKNKCEFQRSLDKQDLIIQLSDNKDALFKQSQSVPTEFGQKCFKPICEDLLNQLLPIENSNTIINIDGHSSSEWKGQCKIDGSLSDQFDCNLKLSNDRAVSVFQMCRGVINEILKENNFTNKNIKPQSEEALERHFRARGYSSAEPIFFRGTNKEDPNKSRRVEFSIESRRK